MACSNAHAMPRRHCTSPGFNLAHHVCDAGDADHPARANAQTMISLSPSLRETIGTVLRSGGARQHAGLARANCMTPIARNAHLLACMRRLQLHEASCG